MRPSEVMLTSMGASGAELFTALSSRLPSTWRSRSESARTRTASVGFVNVTVRSGDASPKASIASATQLRRSMVSKR